LLELDLRRLRLEGILRLRQVMTWPQLFTDGLAIKENTDPELYTGRSKKHEVLMDSIESHPDEKALVFTQFTVETDRIQEMLTERGIPTFRIDGHVTDKEERETRIEQFRRAPANAVFLIQIRAGGVGLNLQEYDRIVFVSPWWTSALMDQAIARAVRMGQTSVVHVYHLALAAEKTGSVDIDKLVSAKAQQKREMLRRLFTFSASPASALSAIAV
jgi:SNF2 family DNA or RNA helicase